VLKTDSAAARKRKFYYLGLLKLWKSTWCHPEAPTGAIRVREQVKFCWNLDDLGYHGQVRVKLRLFLVFKMPFSIVSAIAYSADFDWNCTSLLFI
jgi:hypothetical protein